MTESISQPTGGTTSVTSDLLFSIARRLLFEFDPERAHDMTLALLDRPALQNWIRRRYATAVDPARASASTAAPAPTSADSAGDPRPAGSSTGTASHFLGVAFRNRVGLAAGLDKNGDHIDALGALGFGSIEIGTVTPRPQPGNPRPRVFRLPNHGALINRMGFNNLGVDHLVRQVERRRWQGPLGINIGKNAATPIEQAADDYVLCLQRAYPLADWVTVNISSPNTANLRDLQHGDALHKLLARLKNEQARLTTRHGRHVPLAVKIAPDMDTAALDAFCTAVREHEIEAVISGNTTNQRATVAGHIYARESGGLSGAPLRTLADTTLAAVAERLAGNDVTLIGTGGIASGTHAAEKLALGADLVQLYTGLIYHGPALVRDAINATTATPSPRKYVA